VEGDPLDEAGQEFKEGIGGGALAHQLRVQDNAESRRLAVPTGSASLLLRGSLCCRSGASPKTAKLTQYRVRVNFRLGTSWGGVATKER
jgi:hypothetical protein